MPKSNNINMNIEKPLTVTKLTNINLASWNLCLGLRTKKDYVSNVINSYKIDICCMQEVDLEPDYPVSLLTFKGYSIEVENSSTKARTGTYISNMIPYTRKANLEDIVHALHSKT